ncbi:MAG: chemotaxis protein CheW [Symploca sp. SIO1A3]|nr:chemotaxis protein CheW [Symploca sp. SIO2C1]NER51714.1 chemotaxis protein CheW [Symploca sp. SIO1A3]
MADTSVKLIVFQMGSLNLALPIEVVYKILNHKPIYGSGINQVGVVHLDEQEVTVVDLYRRLFHSSSTSKDEDNSYLVIVQNTTNELYGIPVVDTPILMEVPLSQVRVLPESYRRADTLDIASHVAVINQAGSPLTVFLLDVELLLPIFQKMLF